MGHNATVRQSPGSAIEAIQKNVFDAAIIDLRMPGGSGWDVIDYLREHSPETVSVISTGHGDRDDAIRNSRGISLRLPAETGFAFEIINVLDRIGEKKSLENKTIALESRSRK